MSTTTQNQSQKPEIDWTDDFDKDEKQEWLITDMGGKWELVSKTETEVKEMMEDPYTTESPNWVDYFYVQEFEENVELKEPKFQPINFENLLHQHMELTAKYNELSHRFAEQAKQNEEKEKKIQGTSEFLELCDVNKDGVYVNYETRNIASRLIDGNITDEDEEEEKELKCLGFRPQSRPGECGGCKMICEECENLMIVEEEEEECECGEKLFICDSGMRLCSVGCKDKWVN